MNEHRETRQPEAGAVLLFRSVPYRREKKKETRRSTVILLKQKVAPVIYRQRQLTAFRHRTYAAESQTRKTLITKEAPRYMDAILTTDFCLYLFLSGSVFVCMCMCVCVYVSMFYICLSFCLVASRLNYWLFRLFSGKS